MNSSFYNGISGIKTNQFGIDVWADNIANVNSTGYKASIPRFSNIYDRELAKSLFGPVNSDIGYGATKKSTSTNFKYGSIISTENKFDLAINGNGWFGVLGEGNKKYFTRAGDFHKDKDGYLVDNNGNYLTGTDAQNFLNGIIVDNPKKNISLSGVGKQSKIKLSQDLVIPSKPTTKVHFSGSLNSDIIKKYSPITKKEEEVANVEIYKTDLFDKNGNKNKLKVKFTKIVPQQKSGVAWKAEATLFDIDNNIISSNSGELKFNERGAIVSNTLTSIDNNGKKIALDFGTYYDKNKPNSGFDGLVSLNGFISERRVEKDGYVGGKVMDYNIDSDGTVIANFDNNQHIPISKIAIYNFKNQHGLKQNGSIYYEATPNSGQPTFYVDKQGKIFQSSTISTHKLEVSNTSLTTALTELLVMQKAFDASAKSITTSDQLIQNAINMKK